MIILNALFLQDLVPSFYCVGLFFFVVVYFLEHRFSHYVYPANIESLTYKNNCNNMIKFLNKAVSFLCMKVSSSLP